MSRALRPVAVGLVLALAGCRATAPVAPEQTAGEADVQQGLAAYRDARWPEARAAFQRAWDAGRTVEAAPFLAAAAMVEGKGDAGLDAALAIVLQASRRSKAADAMIAHLVTVGFRRALALDDEERARELLGRLPRGPRYTRLDALLAARHPSADARLRVDAARTRAPFDLDLATAARRIAFAQGRPAEGVAAVARLAPPRGREDLMLPRWCRMEAAAAAGDRAELARAAAGLGWLDEVEILCAEGDPLVRDVHAIRAIARTLARYHEDATANSSATARAGGLSLPRLEARLRAAAAAAGLDLAPARIERPLPLSTEVDCITPLLAGLEPPALPGRDTLAELMARYGLALDLHEAFGAADGRLFHAAGLFRARLRGWGQEVETTVLVGDDTLVPGGVPFRLGTGGIAGRACMTRSGVIILADAVRPDLARLRDHGGTRVRAYREVFHRELDHTLRHELGHVLDFATLLPLEEHLDKALWIAWNGGFSAPRIEARFEEGAERVALALAEDPAFAAAHGLRRLAIDPDHPGVILAVAAGGDPWRNAYMRAAERLAAEVDTAALRAIGARRAFELAIPWPQE